MQQCAVRFILLQDNSTCFGCLPHPSSGVHKTVTTASGTGHNIGATTSLQHGQVPTWPCLPHPSSGVHKTVTTASGTGHNIGATTSLQHGQVDRKSVV